MVAVLLIAAAFRFAAIGDAPPGWRDDELIELDMDRRIVQGWRPLFIAEAEGHEPFYHYLHAATIALFGENGVGYKWLPFAFGMLSVALTFALARRMFDWRVALLAAALMAVSFWPVAYARLGLRHIGVVPLMLGAFYLLYPRPLTASKLQSFDYAQDKSSKSKIPNSLAAGLLLGAALMTYFAGRALPLILAGFLVYLLVFLRTMLRRVWLHDVAAIVLAVVLAAPMFVEIARTPGAEKRTEVVGGPLIAALRGDIQSAVETTIRTLGMFTFAGDPESLYNVPGRPVFDWLTGLCFYLGVVLCLLRIRRIECGFALVWLLIGIAPAFVSVPAASFSHTIAAQPVVYLLAAYGAVEAYDLAVHTARLSHRRWAPYALPAFSLGLVLLASVWTIRDYFGAWAHDPFVRFQYHAPTRDIARWLDENPDVVDVAIGTHPNYLWLDLLALELDLVRDGVMARWFNPGAALVFPREGVVVLSPTQTPGYEIESLLMADAELQQQTLDSAGGPALALYRRNPPRMGFTPPPNGTFDGSITLRRIPTSSETASPGDLIVWRTLWQIDQSVSQPRLKSFLHVLDAQGQIAAGDDREDVNVSSLQAGDVFWQVSSATLPTDLAPGVYQVEAGWYHPETGERLRLADGSDSFPLHPIEVTAP